MNISKILKMRYIKVLVAFIALIMLLGTTMVWAEEVTGEDIDGVWVYDLSYKDGDDLNTFHYWATFDGTYWEVNRPTSSSGTGNFDSFLRIQASPTEKGYNTDAKKTEFDTKVGVWTHAITLAEIPFNADSEDIGYFGREFLVDINETTGGSEIQVDDYEFWMTSQADILGYAPTGEGPSTQWSEDNPEPVWVGEIDWDFNSEEFYDRALIMDYLVNPGSGWADYRVIIPNDYFMDALERYNAREGYDDLTPETAYLVLYVDHSDTDSGFEEWGVRVVEGNPSVSITKTGDALSKIGDDVTYTYEVTNTGDVALDLVNIIDDKLDTIDEFGQVGRFSDVLAVGETETVQVTHEIPAGATDPYVNIVTANYTYNGMPVMDLGGNVPTDSHSVNLFQPSVTLTKTGDETGKVTDDVTYNIRIENTSSADTPTLMFDSFVDSLVSGAVLPAELTNGLTTGEIVEFSYDYTVMAGDADPLVNTATVHFHPDGFTNDIWASDSHSIDLFQPAIDVTKVGDELSKIGDEVTYTITVYNNSSTGTPTMYFDITDTMLGINETDVVIANGDNYVIEKTMLVPEGAADPFVNTVDVHADFGPDSMFPNTFDDSARWETNLFQPSVTLTKTGDETGKVTDDVTYNIRIENTSSADTPTLMFDSFVDTLVPGAVLPEELTNGLTTGEIVEFSYDYTVMEGDPDPLVNTATVHFHPDGFTNDIWASDSHSIDLFQPAIDVTKVGDELSKIGDEVTYTITVYNNSSTGTPTMYFDITDTMLGINETDVVIANGDNYVIEKTMLVPEGAADPFVNTVDVHADFGPDSMFPNTFDDSARWETNLFQPSVTLTKTGDETGKVTDDVTYNIRIENTSSADTPTLMFDSFVDTLVPGAVLPEELTNGLTTGEVVEFSYDYTVMEGDPDPLVNTATVHFHPDGFTNDITANDTHSVDLFQPSIDVTKVGDELSKIGDEVTYTITVYNNSSTGTPTMYFDITDTMLGINETDVVIVNGDNYVIEKTMLVPEGAADPFVNTVDVHADFGPDSMFPNTFDDSARWETNLFQPSVTLTKTGVETGKVTDDVTYNIRIENTSSADTPTLMFDSFVDTLVPGAVLPEELTNGLTTGEVVEFSYDYTVMEGDPDPLVNTATVHFHPDGFTNDITANDTHSVDLFQPSIDVTKVGDELSKIGDEVTYTITVYNNSSTGTPTMYFDITDTMLGINETDVVIANGDNYVIEKTMLVPEGAADPFVNTVDVHADFGPDSMFPNTFDDSARWETNLFQPSVEIEKTGDLIGKVGDDVTYTFTITNTSSEDSPDLILEIITDTVLGDLTSYVETEGLDVLSYGESGSFDVTYTVQEGDPDPLENTVYILYHPEGFPNDVEDEASHSVNLFQPSVEIEKTGDLIGKVGDDVTYTFTITNTSSEDSPDLILETITDTVLGDLTSYVETEGLDVLSYGESGSFDVTYTVQEGDPDPLENTVYILYHPEGFPNDVEDEASHSVNLFQPSISITKVADKTEVKVGDTVTYTITVNNTSSADTPDMEFVVSDAKLGFSESVTLASGDSKSWDVSLVVTDDMWMNDNPFVNTVTTTASPIGFPNMYRAEDSWTINIYKEETAWALWNPLDEGENTNMSIIKTNNWGWYLGPLDNTTSSAIEYELWAAAGQNLTENGYLVGSVEVVIDAVEQTVTVYYNVDPDYDLMETHLWIGETPLPVTKKDKMTDAPGQMTFNPGVAYSFEEFDKLYVAAHAVVKIYAPMD